MIQNLWLSLVLLSFLIVGCLSSSEEEDANLTGDEAVLANTDGMVLSYSTNGFSGHLHKAETTSSGCSISQSSLSGAGEEILCWLDVEELDLFFWDQKLEVRVQPGACEYLNVRPYWYWNYPYGSSTRSLTSSSSDGDHRFVDMPSDCLGGDGVADGFGNTGGDDICGASSAAYTGCLTGGAASTPPADISDLCLFDYSDNGGTGPNCDPGTISYQVTTFTLNGEGDACTSESTTFEHECGGEIVNCAAGPGISNDSGGGGRGAINKIIYSYEGAIIGIDIDSMIDRNLFTTTRDVANYTRACLTDNDPGGAGDIEGESYDVDALLEYAATSSEPHNNPAWVTADDGAYANVDPFMDGMNPFYVWECLDEAYETKGTIRLQIRDWDVAFSNSSDSVGDFIPPKMDQTGFEPPPFDNYYLNDLEDWDDLSIVGGTYLDEAIGDINDLADIDPNDLNCSDPNDGDGSNTRRNFLHPYDPDAVSADSITFEGVTEVD